MSENLSVSHFLNKDSIPEAKTAEEWQTLNKAGKAAWCYYNFDTANGSKYGKLYNWYAVNDPRGLVPKGWHVPTNADWEMMVNSQGGVNYAGNKLKGTEGWLSKTYITNLTGFTGLPGGQCLSTGTFSDLNNRAYWWTTSGEVASGNQIYSVSLINASFKVMYLKQDKEMGLSVRCIKD